MGNTVLNLSDYKMNCSDIERMASDYVDSDLVETVSYAVRKHSDSCHACSSLLDDISDISHWASNLGDMPMPEGVSERLRERLKAL